MARHHILTLLTDFGLTDPYVAEMKGIILSLLPDATVVDISHSVPPGDVLAGAFILRQALPRFPSGTVHCAVVDPGVGTDRRILAAHYAGQTVVFPDNGLITLVNRDLPLAQIVVVRNDRYFNPEGVSVTFHGRDIFAPVAAHLSAGLPLERLGPPAETFQLLDLPEPSAEGNGSLSGQVVYVDGFGNLVTNIPASLLRATFGDATRADVTCGGRSVGMLRAAYGFAEANRPLALINSMALLEIAVNGGRACEALSAGVGTEVRVRPAGR